jgi:hypothetical protein
LLIGAVKVIKGLIAADFYHRVAGGIHSGKEIMIIYFDSVKHLFFCVKLDIVLRRYILKTRQNYTLQIGSFIAKVCVIFIVVEVLKQQMSYFY